MDKKQKKIVIIIVVLVALLIFFYPKDCKTWGTSNSLDVIFKDCDCLGFKFAMLMPAGGGSIDCYGVPLSHGCYTAYTYSPGNRTITDVPCP